MKVVVLAGPESSGKSCMTARLLAHFGGEAVGEYVRYFIEQEARDTCYADIPIIAAGQLRWEDEARARQPHLLILDTHLLSNRLWSLALFADCPAWLERQLLARHYDLHLLMAPETIEWVDDGQRCQPDLADRQAYFAASQQWLVQHHQLVNVIHGDWDSRCEQAISAVERLLTHP